MTVLSLLACTTVQFFTDIFLHPGFSKFFAKPKQKGSLKDMNTCAIT